MRSTYHKGKQFKSSMKKINFIMTLSFAAAMPVCGADAKASKANDQLEKQFAKVIQEKLYETSQCESYIKINETEDKEVIAKHVRVVIKDEVAAYLAGGNGFMGDFASDRNSKIRINEDLIALKEKLKNKGAVINSYRHLYIKDEASRAVDYFVGRKPQTDGLLFMYCEIAAAAIGAGENRETYKEIVSYVEARPENARIGHFDISAGKCISTKKVGTGNKFFEPKAWDGSRFFIVNASFKNMDTESRLPTEGSLHVKYNGAEYKFDSVEPIMLEGYNIWLKQVNPLITMKAKLVYRIPDEIEGEVFWEPGRNKEGIRLWCGNVKASK